MSDSSGGNKYTKREFGVLLKVLTVMSSLIGILYLAYIGIIFYDLWFAPNPAGCGTPHVWGLMASGILFAPIGLVFGGLQLWARKRTILSLEWDRFCLSNAIFLLSLSALGTTFFISVLF